MDYTNVHSFLDMHLFVLFILFIDLLYLVMVFHQAIVNLSHIALKMVLIHEKQFFSLNLNYFNL